MTIEEWANDPLACAEGDLHYGVRNDCHNDPRNNVSNNACNEKAPSGSPRMTGMPVESTPLPRSSAASPYWFLATTPQGEIALGVWPEAVAGLDAHSGAMLDAAQRLGRAEPLICLLEDWLGVPLDLNPGAPTGSGDELLKAKLTWSVPPDETAVTETAIVRLPLDLLAQVSAPPAELAAALCWEAVRCQVTLSSITLPQSQLERLETGGLVLMPASFEPFWRCQARLRARPTWIFSAELDIGQQRLIFEPHAPQTANPPGAGADTEEQGMRSAAARQIDIVLRQELSIPIDRLAGWAEQPVCGLGHRLAEFEVELRSPQAILAHGDLLPIGNGYGVLVKSVTDRQARLAAAR
jgi:hypothetical protein